MPVVEESHYRAILSSRVNSGVFVETGTALGVTTKFMSDHFDMVYSVEFNDDLYWSAFQQLHEVPNVRLIRGDSAEYLHKIDYLIPIRSTFFLDAHSVDDPDVALAGSGYTPIHQELEAVLNIKQHVVLVDDSRLFDGVVYPTLQEVKKFAKARYFDMRLAGDIIVLEHRNLGEKYE